MRRSICIVSLMLASAIPANAEFVPGRLYTSATYHFPSWEDPDVPSDAIFEVDPLTGNWREFARVPFELTGNMTGLTFTPDGSRLRAALWYQSRIVEIDGDGNIEEVLGPADGVLAPFGSNCIAYDQQGNFFVGNGARIMRFPASGGPPSVFADQDDGISGSGPIAVAPDGSIYYAPAGLQNPRIRRITPDGQSSVFDQIPGLGIASLTLDDAGNIFVVGDGVFRYDDEDPTTQRILTDEVRGAPPRSTIALSPDQQALYLVVNSHAFSVDVLSGAVDEVTPLIGPGGYRSGGGLAIYIPEPGTLVLLMPLLFVLRRR